MKYHELHNIQNDIRLDWSYLDNWVKEEQRNGDPIASLIHRLHLQKGHVSLLLTRHSRYDGGFLIALNIFDLFLHFVFVFLNDQKMNEFMK